MDGLGARQGQYVSLTRGREANYVYAVTGQSRAADVREGSRPAPELGRARRLMREHAGLQAPTRAPAVEQAPQRDPVSVVAEVLGRDGAQLSATETLRRELSNADHLGVLGSIWYDLTRGAQAACFEQALRDNLTAAEAEAALSDPACTWLWRSLREAEAAGLDGTEVLQQAIASRHLAGARDVARVLDTRVRHMAEGNVPRLPGSWAERVPETGDPPSTGSWPSWPRRWTTGSPGSVSTWLRRAAMGHPGARPGSRGFFERLRWEARACQAGRVPGTLRLRSAR